MLVASFSDFRKSKNQCRNEKMKLLIKNVLVGNDEWLPHVTDYVEKSYIVMDRRSREKISM